MARRSNQKRPRDPNAPKRNLAAWELFFSEHREGVKKENSNLSYQEISSKLGEMWRGSDDATKLRYQKQSQLGQAEYDEKLAAYKEEQKNKRSQSSKSKKNTGRAKKGNSSDETNEHTNQS